MENVIQLLLNENLLPFCVIGRLAKTSKHLRFHLLKVKNKFTWIAKSHSLDLLRWRTNISDTHHVLQTALKMNHCAQNGVSLLSWCCYRLFWDKTATLNQSRPIDLEAMIKSDTCLIRLYKGKSACLHNSTHESHDTIPTQLFQHTLIVNDGWITRTRCKNTRWSGSKCGQSWLTISDSVRFCECHHCKTYKTYPKRDCLCPVCSDPVKGPTYWTQLTNIESDLT